MEVDNVALNTYELLCDVLDINQSKSIKDTFQIINQKISELRKDHTLKNPLVKDSLSKKELSVLENVNDAMYEDYRLREELFKLRSQATIESFQYSKAKHFKIEDYNTMIKEGQKHPIPSISKLSRAEILSASEDMLLIEKISNIDSSKGTNNSTKKYILEDKPKDRGGRMVGH
uniref:ING domain-containing protein n=1 Tax=Parastrongyloides trichosuri TaxID=131310 RepID=A0A0N4ZYF1_PARTI